MKTKILVTGSKGQLGSEIRFLESNFSDFELHYTDVAELDITSLEAINSYIENVFKPDYIINCAAYTAVDKAEDEPELAALINKDASANLAKACQANNITLVHVSTDYVFDGKQHLPYIETDAYSPNSVYGRTKQAGEEAIIASECEFFIFRTSWLYSTFGNNFVKTIQRLAKDREQLSVLFDQVGSPTYARDLAQAILDVITQRINGNRNSGIYHFSNEGVCSWFDFAQQIVKLSNINCHILAIRSEEFPQKANRPFYSVMDKSKIKNDFKLQIPYWFDSLQTCIEEM